MPVETTARHAERPGEAQHADPADALRMLRPRHAIANHFFNEEGTRYGIYDGIRETYDGPLSMATDMMVWNITKDEITERMAVSPDEAWDVPGEDKPLAPDPNRKSELNAAMAKGRMDVSAANRQMVEQFMKQHGLTKSDLDPGN